MGGNLVGDGRGQPQNAQVLGGTRIVIVLWSLELGGAERQALHLGRYLADEHRAQVEVWGFGKPGRTAALCDEHGIRWRIFPLSWTGSRMNRLGRLAKFAWLLRRSRPDVILSYTMLPNVVCGLTWRWTGARLFIWNQRDEGRFRMGRKAERWAIRQTPLFVSNSQHGADFLLRTLGVKADRIRVIHNGVELTKSELDRIVWRSHLGVTENCFLACMVANLHAFKDHKTLLKAWRILLNRLHVNGGSAVLLLAGYFGKTSESLKALAYDLELGKSVRFLGQVNDISGLLDAVDIGVFSSCFEGCPNGVLECMGSGLPIAGTDIPRIREAVGPDGCEFLTPPGDAEALADRILSLAMNPELRSKLGTANRRRIEAEFNPRLSSSPIAIT